MFRSLEPWRSRAPADPPYEGRSRREIGPDGRHASAPANLNERTFAVGRLDGEPLPSPLERLSIKPRRHVIASETKQSRLPPLLTITGLLRRFASRNDDSARSKTALTRRRAQGLRAHIFCGVSALFIVSECIFVFVIDFLCME